MISFFSSDAFKIFSVLGFQQLNQLLWVWAWISEFILFRVLGHVFSHYFFKYSIHLYPFGVTTVYILVCLIDCTPSTLCQAVNNHDLAFTSSSCRNSKLARSKSLGLLSCFQGISIGLNIYTALCACLWPSRFSEICQSFSKHTLDLLFPRFP